MCMRYNKEDEPLEVQMDIVAKPDGAPTRVSWNPDQAGANLTFLCWNAEMNVYAVWKNRWGGLASNEDPEKEKYHEDAKHLCDQPSIAADPTPVFH